MFIFNSVLEPYLPLHPGIPGSGQVDRGKGFMWILLVLL